MTGDLAALLRTSHVDLPAARVTPAHVAELAALSSEGVISSAAAKAALAEAFHTGDAIRDIVDRRGLRQVSDHTALSGLIDEVIAENPGPAEQFRAGKEGALNALIGQVMKKTRGSANPAVAGELLRDRLR
jgi:aspartyl-tRNA(Asn)/glutamyl-tRNA(Gln) amidotransferase subunit B